MDPSRAEKWDAAIDAAAARAAHGVKAVVKGGVRAFEAAKPHLKAVGAAAAKHGAKVLDNIKAAHKAATAHKATRASVLIGAIAIGAATFASLVFGRMF